MPSEAVPKVLWNYWVESGAPPREIRDICSRSWQERGGFDEIVVVERSELHRFLPASDLPASFDELPPQKQANAVRIALLHKYGGVWADASVLITGDVPSWLSRNTSEEGVFFFQNVDRGRLLDNWFLASAPGSQFMGEWMDAYLSFFSSPRTHMAHSQRLHTSKIAFHLLARLNNNWVRSSPNRTRWWARFPLNRLPFYPYFIHHYMANDLLLRPAFANLLRSMRYVPAADALGLRRAITLGLPASEVQLAVTRNHGPINKLDLHVDYDRRSLDLIKKLARGGKC